MILETEKILEELPTLETIITKVVPVLAMGVIAYVTSHYHPRRNTEEEIAPIYPTEPAQKDLMFY